MRTEIIFSRSKQQFNILKKCKLTRLNTCDLKDTLYGCCYSSLLFCELYLIILPLLMPVKGWKVSDVPIATSFYSYPVCNTQLSAKISLLIQALVSIKPRDTWRLSRHLCSSEPLYISEGTSAAYFSEEHTTGTIRLCWRETYFHYETFLPFYRVLSLTWKCTV